jgi:ParB-like chromosome segregation protein Spo0J
MVRPIESKIVAIGDIVPYARNPRVNDHAVDRMAAMIEEFGFKVPVLMKSNGSLIDGHLRLKAAQKLDLHEIPAIICDDWTEAQIKAFRILVNKSVAWADWDNDLLKLEFEELKELDFDLDFTGFDENERKLISEGWTSDLESLDKIKDNEDGIASVIKISVPQEIKEDFKEWLQSMIDDSGYDDVKLS